MSFAKNLFDNAVNLIKNPLEDRDKEQKRRQRRLARATATARSEALFQGPAIERSRLLGSSAVGGSDV
jgi:hypothetical protein